MREIWIALKVDLALKRHEKKSMAYLGFSVFVPFLFFFLLNLFLSDMRSPIWPIGGTTALSVPSILSAIKIRSKFSWGLSRDRASNCTRIRRCTCAVEQADVVEFQISHFLFVFSLLVSLLLFLKLFFYTRCLELARSFCRAVWIPFPRRGRYIYMYVSIYCMCVCIYIQECRDDPKKKNDSFRVTYYFLFLSLRSFRPKRF